MPEWTTCETCGGDGKVGSNNDEECSACGGSGLLPKTETCPTCLATGYVGSDPCPTCFMQGTIPIHGSLPETLKKLGDLEDKINDVMNKCDDILEAI